MIGLYQISQIKEMYRNGDGISSIAREMGIDWKTADKYVRKTDFNDTLKDHIRKARASKLDP